MPEPFKAEQISAAILAGGEGRRAGGLDKGLIELAGRPLIAHVMQALQGQVRDVRICANRNPTEYAAYAPVCADRAPGFLGPLAGIARALEACPTPWLLVVPVDSPCLPGDLAQRLFSAAVAARRDAAVAHDGQRRQPLFCLYRRELVDSAARALHEDHPVWRWQDEIGTIEVDFSDVAEGLTNLNSLEEIRRWEQTHAE